MSRPPEISAGTEFDHYEVLSLIGRGGMGEVWKARDTKLGRFVAIKFIPSAWATDAQAVERLRVEARAASSLNHPNICTIYDFREYQGHPLIVMELMRGETLSHRLGGGPLKTSEAVEIGIQVAEALVAAHRRGIIHRDIKPENIFLTEDGPVKVLDFGLAKRFPQAMDVETTTLGASSALTAAGAAAGTISYMSPEQVSAEELDGRTDLFSLGVVLYNCATGHPPFTGKTMGLVLSSILNRAPVAPIALNPEIPPRFQEVIFNCLEKDRELRYQSANDLRAELKRIKRDLDLIHARPHALTSESGIDVARPKTSPGSRREAEAAGTRWMSRVGTALVAMAVIAVGIMLWQRAPAPEGVGDPEPVTGQVVLPRESLDVARESLAAGDYRAALENAETALGEAPDDPEAARILEEARAGITRFDEAVAETGRQLDAGNAGAAQESLEAATAIDPTAPVLAGLSSRLVDLLRRLNEEANAEAEAARRLAEEAQTATGTPSAGIPPPPAPEPPDPAPAAPTSVTPGPTTTPPAAASSLEAEADAAVPLEPVPEPEEAPGTGEPPAQTDELVSTAVPEPVAPASEVEAADEPATDQEAAEADDAEIRRIIGLYESALETKNVDLMRQVKPNLSPAEIESLTTGQQADVEMTILEIVPDGDRAVVRVERRDTFAVGGRPQSSLFEQTLELVRTAGGWVINVFGQ